MATTIHIFTEKEAFQTFQQIIPKLKEDKKFEPFLLEDRLDIGRLRFEEQPFSLGRKKFFQEISNGSIEGPNGDLERLMEISTRLSNFPATTVCFWMGNNAKDVCAYYWLLHFLKKHLGKVGLINIAGLPFLNQENQLFYPTRVREISGHEMQKAMGLAHLISAAQWETDMDEWDLLRNEHQEIRILKTRRKIESHPPDFYDATLKKLCQEIKDPTRISTIVRRFKEQYDSDCSEVYLEFRLQELGQTGDLILEEGKVKPKEGNSIVS